MEPGQFEANWASKCHECDELIRKGDTAGYNENDEVVCEDCWIPLRDR